MGNIQLTKHSARLSAIQSNQLIKALTDYDLWRELLPMLRPLDIVSLVRAIVFYLRPNKSEAIIYLRPWRQIFHDIRFLKGNRGSILGKDIGLLRNALRRWDYFDTKEMKLLVIAKIPRQNMVTAKIALVASIDRSYAFGIDIYDLSTLSQPVQTCIIFNDSKFFEVRLSSLWFKYIQKVEQLPEDWPAVTTSIITLDNGTDLKLDPFCEALRMVEDVNYRSEILNMLSERQAKNYNFTAILTFYYTTTTYAQYRDDYEAYLGRLNNYDNRDAATTANNQILDPVISRGLRQDGLQYPVTSTPITNIENSVLEARIENWMEDIG